MCFCDKVKWCLKKKLYYTLHESTQAGSSIVNGVIELRWLMLSPLHIYCTSPCGPVFSFLLHGSQVHILKGSSWETHPQEVSCFQLYFTLRSQVASAAMQLKLAEKGITTADLKLSSRLRSAIKAYCCCQMEICKTRNLQQSAVSFYIEITVL